MDPAAQVRFTRIYESHYAAVLAYCGRRVNRAEAEDIASEVFVVLWRRLAEVDPETTLPWLYGVAHRMIANRWRGAARRRRLVLRAFSAAEPSPEPIDEVVVRREQDRNVLAALSRLRPDDGEILRLSAWEELTAPQIAQVMGCSVSAAEQRLHRAKTRLAKLLTPSIASPTPVEQGGGT